MPHTDPAADPNSPASTWRRRLALADDEVIAAQRALDVVAQDVVACPDPSDPPPRLAADLRAASQRVTSCLRVRDRYAARLSDLGVTVLD